MRVEWFGQSAFHLQSDRESVFIDPFADITPLTGRGVTFEYPQISGVSAHLLLVTHEHLDHNGVEAIDGDPVVLRSTAGKLQSPVGEVLAVASEHDPAAGTERGPNTIFRFELDRITVCHFGDFGQSALRDEQADAIRGGVDLLIVPVGDGPTIGADGAWKIVKRLQPKWVVPMHYRTERIGFLEPADAFLAAATNVYRAQEPSFETRSLPLADGPLVVLPACP